MNNEENKPDKEQTTGCYKSYHFKVSKDTIKEALKDLVKTGKYNPDDLRDRLTRLANNWFDLLDSRDNRITELYERESRMAALLYKVIGLLEQYEPESKEQLWQELKDTGIWDDEPECQADSE